jgi:hypothetical protein
MGSSLVDQLRDRRGELVSKLVRDRGFEGPAQGASAHRDGDAGDILADIGATAIEPTRQISYDRARGSADHPQKLLLRA